MHVLFETQGDKLCGLNRPFRKVVIDQRLLLTNIIDTPVHFTWISNL